MRKFLSLVAVSLMGVLIFAFSVPHVHAFENNLKPDRVCFVCKLQKHSAIDAINIVTIAPVFVFVEKYCFVTEIFSFLQAESYSTPRAPPLYR